LSSDIADGTVKFWEHINFGGESFTMNAGENKPNLGPSWNDKITSLKIGKNIRVTLCKNTDCNGNNWDDKINLVGPY